MELKEIIEKYQPYNKQESKDKETMLKWMNTFDDLLTRKNEFAHFTASAWVVNPERTKVLMIYHNIYQSWAWTGGHADGEANLKYVAEKELQEETGITQFKVLDPSPFSLEILTVNGHVKKGKYVSSHLHLNLTYLIEAKETESLQINQKENSDVCWMDIEEVEKKSTEEWIKTKIYRKLKEKEKEKEEKEKKKKEKKDEKEEKEGKKGDALFFPRENFPI